VSHSRLRDSILITLQEAAPEGSQLCDECFIIGASALVLAGIDLNYTPDIDLLTSSRDADRLSHLWSARRLDYTPQQPELFRSTYSRFKFSAMDVEVMGNLEINRAGAWTPLLVHDAFEMEDSPWKIPTLKEQMRILQIFNRPKDLDRIALIDQYLTKVGTTKR
jgi:hypothetical protein